MKNVTLRFFRNLNSGRTTKQISVANNWILKEKELVVAFCIVDGRPIISAPILNFTNVKSGSPIFNTRANSTYKILDTVRKRIKVKNVTFVNRKSCDSSNSLKEALKWLQEDGDVYCELFNDGKQISSNVVDIDTKKKSFEVEEGITFVVE